MLFHYSLQNMDFSDIREYLAAPARQSSSEVALDAFRDGVPGAVQIVTMVMALRVNRRSRRTFDEAQSAFLLQRRPRWFELLMGVVWNFYRVSLTQRSIPLLLNL